MENLITIITDPIISIIAIVQLSIFIRTLYKLGKFRFYFPKEQKWSIEENNAHYSIIVKNSKISTPNGNFNKNTFHNTNTFPETCCIDSMQKALSH